MNLDIHHHLLVNVSVADNVTKFLEADLAIVILVSKQDCLVHNLLQLCVFQVVPHHHFQHLKIQGLQFAKGKLLKTNLEKLSVGDVPVIIDIIYSEGKSQLAVLVPLHAEL